MAKKFNIKTLQDDYLSPFADEENAMVKPEDLAKATSKYVSFERLLNNLNDKVEVLIELIADWKTQFKTKLNTPAKLKELKSTAIALNDSWNINLNQILPLLSEGRIAISGITPSLLNLPIKLLAPLRSLAKYNAYPIQINLQGITLNSNSEIITGLTKYIQQYNLWHKAELLAEIGTKLGTAKYKHHFFGSKFKPKELEGIYDTTLKLIEQGVGVTTGKDLPKDKSLALFKPILQIKINQLRIAVSEFIQREEGISNKLTPSILRLPRAKARTLKFAKRKF